MPVNASITGSVADLFATLGLDVAPLGSALGVAKGMITEAGADMSLSLGALQARMAAVTTSLTGGMEATSAYGAALQAMGIQTGHAVKLSAERAAALQAEQNALAFLIAQEKEALFFKEQQMAYDAWEAKARSERFLRIEQEAQAEVMAAAIEANAMKDLRRVESFLNAEHAKEVEAKILLANQYAQAEVQAAAIVAQAAKVAQASQSGGGGSGMHGGARVGPGGVSPYGYLGGGSMMAAGATLFGGYEVLKQATDFDNAMNKSLSIMGEVSEFQKGQMRESAQDLADQYGISSVEIVGSFYDMTSAGLGFQESLKNLPAVTAYAFTASKDGVLEMGKAAEQLTTVFNALKGTGGDLQHISDLLLKADSIAAGTGEQFAQALAGKGAGAIRILNKSAEEGLAILATLSQVGIRGANAQTAMVQILRDLPREAEKYSDTLIEINGNTMTYKELLYDSTGAMKNFADILATLEQLFQGASTEVIQHDLALLHLNSRTNQSLQAMLGMSGAMRDYETQLNSASGTTKRIADIRLDAAATQFKELKEHARNFAVDIGTFVLPAVLELVKVLRGVDPASAFGRDLGAALDTYMKSNRYMMAGATRTLQQTADERMKSAVPSPAVNSMTGQVLPPAKSDEELAQENRIKTIQLGMERDHAARMLEIESNALDAKLALHQISNAQFLAQQLAINKRREEIQKDYEQKLLDMDVGDKAGERDAKVMALDSKAQDARLALDQKFKLDMQIKEAEHHEKLMEQIRAFHAKLTNYEQKQAEAREKIVDKSGDLIDKTLDKAKNHAFELADDFLRLLALIAQLDRESNSKKIERQRQMDSLHKHIEDLIEKDDAASDKSQNKRIRSGYTIIQLARQTESEIRTVSAGLAELITEGGKFGDVMERSMKQLVRTIIQDAIQVGFGALLRTIFESGSALNELGKKLEAVWGIGQKVQKIPFPGAGIPTGAGGPTGMGTPTWMEANTGAVKDSTEAAGKVAAATLKDVTATNADIGATATSTKVEQHSAAATEANTQQGVIPNTTATEKNTAAIELLTGAIHQNTAAESANTLATNANTAALIALTAALMRQAVGQGVGGVVQQLFGGGGSSGLGLGGGGGWGWDGAAGYDWSWLYNLPLGGGSGGNGSWGSQSQFSMLEAGERGGLTIDMRGAVFHGNATEAQLTQSMNKVVDKLRLNRVKV